MRITEIITESLKENYDSAGWYRGVDSHDLQNILNGGLPGASDVPIPFDNVVMGEYGFSDEDAEIEQQELIDSGLVNHVINVTRDESNASGYGEHVLWFDRNLTCWELDDYGLIDLEDLKGTYGQRWGVVPTEELDEVEQLTYIGKNKGGLEFRNMDDLVNARDTDSVKHVATMPQGYEIYRVTPEWYRENTAYIAINPQTKKAEIEVWGVEKNNVLSKLNLQANRGNTLKAADFYRFLIVKLNKVLVANAQSPGGQAVWAQLEQFPDVNIHGWYKDKPVNISASDEEQAYAPKRNEFDRSASKEERRANKMQLVAHKK